MSTGIMLCLRAYCQATNQSTVLKIMKQQASAVQSQEECLAEVTCHLSNGRHL